MNQQFPIPQLVEQPHSSQQFPHPQQHQQPQQFPNAEQQMYAQQPMNAQQPVYMAQPYPGLQQNSPISAQYMKWKVCSLVICILTSITISITNVYAAGYFSSAGNDMRPIVDNIILLTTIPSIVVALTFWYAVITLCCNCGSNRIQARGMGIIKVLDIFVALGWTAVTISAVIGTILTGVLNISSYVVCVFLFIGTILHAYMMSCSRKFKNEKPAVSVSE